MSSIAAGRAAPATRRAPLLTALFFLAPSLTAIAPRLAPFLFLLVGLTLIVRALRRGRSWRSFLTPSVAFFALVAVALYAFLSALWSEDPSSSIEKSTTLLAAIFLASAALAALPALDGDEVRLIATAFVAGSLAGAVFVLIEVLTSGALTRAALTAAPLLQPNSTKHMFVDNGVVTFLRLSEFNQNAAMLSFQLWPGLLALFKLREGSRYRGFLLAGFFLALAVPIFLSEHDSSQLGIVIALLVLLIAWRWPLKTIQTLAVAWCLGFAIVIPLDMLAYRAELHQAKWLPQSARARVILWQYTAERVLENPWLGIGADSTAKVRDEQIGRPKKPKGFVFRRSTGQHAHSIFLQSWYELGLFGAILMAIAGAAVALRMQPLPRLAQPFAAAAFASFMTIAGLAWGMWQVWLLCAMALVPIYLALAASPFRENDSPN
jgi:hypothetical protein